MTTGNNAIIISMTGFYHTYRLLSIWHPGNPNASLWSECRGRVSRPVVIAMGQRDVAIYRLTTVSRPHSFGMIVGVDAHIDPIFPSPGEGIWGRQKNNRRKKHFFRRLSYVYGRIKKSKKGIT